MFTTLRNIFLIKQRGAIFGMDARVALVVFGALALIAGYSMLGRIGQTHTAKLVRELQTLEKAFTAMQTDLGQPITHPSTLGFEAQFTDQLFAALREHPAPSAIVRGKWNGPYVSDPISVDHATYGVWSSSAGTFLSPYLVEGLEAPCSAENICYLYIGLTDVPEDVFREVNRVIDENGGAAAETVPINEGGVMYDSMNKTLYFRAVGWDAAKGRTVK